MNYVTLNNGVQMPLIGNPQNPAQMEMSANWGFDADKSKGNVWYGVLEGGVHTFSYDLQYVYNALLNLWK